MKFLHVFTLLVGLTYAQEYDLWDNFNLSQDFHDDVSIEADEVCEALESSPEVRESHIVGPSSNYSEVVIGFLTSYIKNKVAVGAVTLAVQAVNDDPELLPGRTLRFVAADIGSQDKESLASLAIRRMTEMRDKGAIGFIGPEDTCTSEALVAAAWNLPMITFKCADTKVSDKTVYHTFMRTLPPSSKISKSIIALFRSFGWTKVTLIVSKGSTWIPIKEAFKDLASRNGINITSTVELDDYIPSQIKLLEDAIDATYRRTRIYLFIGEHIALVDLAHTMYRKGLLSGGEYMIVSVDDLIYDPRDPVKRYIQRHYYDPHLPTLEPHLQRDMNESFEAFRSVLKITPSYPTNPNYPNITRKIKELSTKSPFCVPLYTGIFSSLMFDSIEVPIFAAHIYDAVLVYARGVTEILNEGLDPRNGTAVFDRIRKRSYHSIRGFDVHIDDNGDAEGNYTVVSLVSDPDSMSYSLKALGIFAYNISEEKSEVLPVFRYIDAAVQIEWILGRPPLAEPPCGFDGEKCINENRTDWRTVVLCTVSALVLAVAAGLVFRHYRHERKLMCLLWKIDMRDVIPIMSDARQYHEDYISGSYPDFSSFMDTFRGCGIQSPWGETDFPDLGFKKVYTHIGIHRGNIVAIKRIRRKNMDLTRNMRKELQLIREVRHENLVPFIGASIDQGMVCVLTSYCVRGSLQDVLSNEDYRLDQMFIASLVADLVKNVMHNKRYHQEEPKNRQKYLLSLTTRNKGMIFLHESEIISHGNLKSPNCLVDSRWVLQISDFGLHEFKGCLEARSQMVPERLFWRAPELLRDPNAIPRGTQKGDVFSFGIILYEIFCRAGPWGCSDLSSKEIIDHLIHPEQNGGVILRPPLIGLNCADYLIRCMQDCWDENPENRPDFRAIRGRLKEMEAGLKPNIFDNMLAMMEKYAYNLESLVQERTDQLVEEKKKTEALLHRMLPKSVAESLKRGDYVEPEHFNSVTIYFSDIVGFTTLSATSTPLQVVDLLNDLYTKMDSILGHYDVYKVETIGDAYMVVSGLPIRNGDQHAGHVASMALHVLDEIRYLQIRHKPGEMLRLRIGIHSGPCVAGVVGLRMPRYCLFGDTVNTASRMESTGDALKIHVSSATKEFLDRLGGYTYEERGMVSVKGKGEMRTYWLTGETPSTAERIRFFAPPTKPERTFAPTPLRLMSRETSCDFLKSRRSSLTSRGGASLNATPESCRRQLGCLRRGSKHGSVLRSVLSQSVDFGSTLNSVTSPLFTVPPPCEESLELEDTADGVHEWLLSEGGLEPQIARAESATDLNSDSAEPEAEPAQKLAVRSDGTTSYLLRHLKFARLPQSPVWLLRFIRPKQSNSLNI